MDDWHIHGSCRNIINVRSTCISFQKHINSIMSNRSQNYQVHRDQNDIIYLILNHVHCIRHVSPQQRSQIHRYTT